MRPEAGTHRPGATPGRTATPYDGFMNAIQHLAPSGSTVAAPPLPERFMFATGIECFADPVMAEMRRLGIEPILDLLHFGVPDWIGDFQNPALPLHLAEYAAAVAARYPWVRYWTPVNEIHVSARMSTLDGLWNEQIRTERAFVTALKHLTAASKLACAEITRVRPDGVIVHSESAEIVHEARMLPTAGITLANRQRFLALDLLFAKPPGAEMTGYLRDNGLSVAEHAWFMQGEPAGAAARVLQPAQGLRGGDPLAPTPTLHDMTASGGRRRTGSSPTRSGPEGSSRNEFLLGSHVRPPTPSLLRQEACQACRTPIWTTCPRRPPDPACLGMR